MPAFNYRHVHLKAGKAYKQNSGYDSDEQYFADLAKAYFCEIEALCDESCRNLRIDDPHLTYFCSSRFLEGCRKDATDTDALVDLYLEAQNMYSRKLSTDLHNDVDLCRANMSGSQHWAAGSYEQAAEKSFTKTDFSTYCLEFDDTVRQGGFETLRILTQGKSGVLGLVSTRMAELEKTQQLGTHVGEAAAVVAKAQGGSEAEAMDCLALSPQCGFSSSSLVDGKEMIIERMWEKHVLARDAAVGI